MCGRYGLVPSDWAGAGLAFGLGDVPAWPGSYNMAPTQALPVVRQQSIRGVAFLIWGLIPPGSPTPKVPFSNINARAESIARRRVFREPFARRRCLVPASGFYEWQSTASKAKQPYWVHPPEGGLWAFAGVWERWGPSADVLESFAIITTEGNAVVAPIHDRMPVIIQADAYDAWLDLETPVEVLTALMRPHAPEKTVVQPVSTWVNAARHDDPRCIEAFRWDPRATEPSASPVQGELPFFEKRGSE